MDAKETPRGLVMEEADAESVDFRMAELLEFMAEPSLDAISEGFLGRGDR